QRGEKRVATTFTQASNRHAGQEKNRHGRPNCPSMLRRTCHPSERVSESCGNGKDAEHLNEVRERRGVFEGMRAVGVEKASAISAPFFNDFLRCYRALGDHLISNDLVYDFSVGSRGCRLLLFAVFHSV